MQIDLVLNLSILLSGTKPYVHIVNSTVDKSCGKRVLNLIGQTQKTTTEDAKGSKKYIQLQNKTKTGITTNNARDTAAGFHIFRVVSDIGGRMSYEELVDVELLKRRVWGQMMNDQ